MRAVSRNRWGLFVAVLVATVFLDAVSKALVTDALGPGASRQTVEIVPGFLSLDYSRNDGVAFGLLSGGSWIVWIAVVAGLVAGGYFIVMSMRSASPLLAVALGLCAGGAIGNLLDRAVRGYVVDFVEAGRWPSFNLADAALTVGLFIVLGLQISSGADRTAS